MRYREARLPKNPDLPCAPRRRSVDEYSDFGSSLWVREYFGGLLFLKPLGTSFNFLPFTYRSQSGATVLDAAINVHI